MTQPNEAVGGATDAPVIATEPTIEDRLSAVVDDDQNEEPEEQAQSDDQPIVAAEDDGEPEEPEEPAVPAPVSWSDEDKAVFSQLDPEAQKVIARRESERDKFLQAKSQEVRQVAQAAQQQALQQVSQLQALHMQQLAATIPAIPEEPSAHLLAEDPYLYAAMVEGHKQAVSQRNAIVAQMQQIAEQHQLVSQHMEVQERQAVVQTLAEMFPEFIAPDTGADLQKTLGATAAELGYPPDTIAAANAQDILAMRKAHEWKTKADKYDALMAKQMDGVRAAKTLPSVTRPGAAQPKGARANERYTNDRKAMRGGDKDAAARVFARFL